MAADEQLDWAKKLWGGTAATRYTFYRSATHPDYVEREIKPTLDLHGLPHSYAPAVAALIDSSGWSVQAAVAALEQVTVRPLPTVKPRRHRFLDFLRRLPGDIADGFRAGCRAIADGSDRVFG